MYRINQRLYIFQCPHDLACPRLAVDKTPCNFETSYTSLPLLGNPVRHTERYSYVVLKKGKKNFFSKCFSHLLISQIIIFNYYLLFFNTGTRSEIDGDWPRLVRPTLKRGKHVFCRMCSNSGNLEEIIFTTSKHGR